MAATHRRPRRLRADCPGEFAIRCPPVRGVLAVVDGRHCGAAALLVGLAFSAVGLAASAPAPGGRPGEPACASPG
ncbi:MAG TPA: hypothetical protein VGL02_30370 [Streptomyces sp.]